MAKQAEKAAEASEEAAKGGGKKKIIVIAVVLVVALAAAYLLVLKPRSAAAAEPAPEPGAVVQLDPVTMNLADGHFLKLGLALQAKKDAHEEPAGAKALDLAIHLMSNLDPAEVTSTKARDKLKAELLKEVEHAYHGDVIDIYFTEFVMQ